MAIWLTSAFWFILGSVQILRDLFQWQLNWGSGGNDEIFNISMILYIVLRRIELEADGKKNLLSTYFSQN